MMLRRVHLKNGLLLLSLCFVGLLGHQLYQYQQATTLNTVLKKLSMPVSPLIDVDSLDLSQADIAFAYAYHLQQQGLFEDAVAAYGQAERQSSPEQLKRVYFNMGNLYLQQAIEVATKMGIDRATALADVAKDLYQSALKQDPNLWPAKYNLEAAQRLSRDLPLGDINEAGEAEESSEELWSAMPGFPIGLP
ncbi:MAG TPA: MxaK protein [Methylophaga aminisulfidivorans]|uniref:MxaK protein n=1 Tax=Methylophaga aminisulfidivorans TaxID=230105 RepID=A0A7C1ZPS1_9GAMM|nr:MxaK protein [Methylophaga aminisulfidivorans]